MYTCSKCATPVPALAAKCPNCDKDDRLRNRLETLEDVVRVLAKNQERMFKVMKQVGPGEMLKEEK